VKDPAPTQIVAPFTWLDPRAHPLADTWLLTLVTVLLVIGVPRLTGGLAIAVAPCAVGLLALALIQFAFALLSARPATRPRVRTRALSALHALGVIVLGLTWQWAGGLENPLFLAVFVLPVIGAVFISRWQPYAAALLSIVTVAVLAAGQTRLAGGLVPALTPGRPFAAFYAPAGYYAVLLQSFAIVELACAVAVEYLRSVFERLHAQVIMARGETLRSQKLRAALLEELPLPAVLIDAETLEILAASAMAVSRWSTHRTALAGQRLFEALQFSYPEAIEALISGRGGTEPLCMVRAGERLLATEVRVQHLADSGRRLALVSVSDTTEAFCVKAALDAAEHAALIVDAAGCVLALNGPAHALFPEARSGVGLARLVPEAAPQGSWWDPGMSRRKKTSLTVMRRAYHVTLSAVTLPGEEARLYVVAFTPASAFAGAERGGTTLSAVMRQP
jgi:hypothetical protein